MKYVYVVLLLLVFLSILVVITLVCEQEYRTVPEEDTNNPISLETELLQKSIPKKIYQTHKTFEKLPKGMQQTLKRTENMHPNCEYVYYDDQTCDEFIEENFHYRIVNAYKTLVPGAYKADLFRYCLLYKHGGIYLDASMYCLKSFEDMIWSKTDKHYQFVSAVDQDQSGGAYNAFIAAVPKHPILAMAINICVHRIERREYGRSTLYPTGPYVLGDAINLYLDQKPGEKIEAGVKGKNDNILILGRGIRFKCRYSHFGNKITEPIHVLIYNREEYADSKYPGYQIEWRDHKKKTYYHALWNKKQIYHS